MSLTGRITLSLYITSTVWLTTVPYPTDRLRHLTALLGLVAAVCVLLPADKKEEKDGR